jgi:hypothetical protein
MDTEISGQPSSGAAKRISLWDLAIVAMAAAVIVVGNVGVVQALDIALDALHR